MKKIITTVLIMSVLLLSGCSEHSTSGKWYDYGNGILNLSTVTRIKHSITNESQSMTLTKTTEEVFNTHMHKNKLDSIALVSILKFDDFTLNIEKKNISSYTELEAMRTKLLGNLANLRDFLDSGDSYLKIAD